MSVFLPSQVLTIPHARRIDKLVCAMHQDRARLLALEADAGFPERAVDPVRVEIRRQRKGWLARILDGIGYKLLA